MNIDPKQLIKLLSYMATFDGGIYKPHTKNPDGKVNCQFIMQMRKENEDYLQWVKSVIENVTSARLTERPDYNTDGYQRKPQLRLESNRHSLFTKLRGRIYIDNHKVIDPHMLRLMDEEALAIIFMCDGGTSIDLRHKNPHAKIDLHTKGFSYADNMALSGAIHDKLGIVSNVHRHGKYYYLNIAAKSHKTFYETVKPYIKPSFDYKFERIAPVIAGW
jgi:hypothetical protein